MSGVVKRKLAGCGLDDEALCMASGRSVHVDVARSSPRRRRRPTVSKAIQEYYCKVRNTDKDSVFALCLKLTNDALPVVGF